MSTPLETNTATMQAILEAVNALPEAGSGGGAVETCDLVLNFFESNFGEPPLVADLTVTTFDGSAISVLNITQNEGTVKIPNVVCGSLVCFFSYKTILSATNAENLSTLNYKAYRITASSGQTATINFTAMD